MKPFPQGLTLEIAEHAFESRVLDTASGEMVDGVVAVIAEVDARPGHDHLSKVTIVLEGQLVKAIAQNAEYQIPEAVLRRLAADNGFDLVPLPDPNEPDTAPP